MGADEELTTTLPYSKKVFGVPSNLYIIGTMNTADRSIALMDTALRRRFHFEEKMSDAKKLKDIFIGKINVKKMFEKINERIEFLYDRDHTIGHSYFMKLKDIKEKNQLAELCNIFSNKIIPLLQEYFYDDWEKIQIVLGDHYKQSGKKEEETDFEKGLNEDRLIQSKKSDEEKIIGFDHDDFENTTTYRVNPKLIKLKIGVKAFTKIDALKKKAESKK